MEVNVVSGNDFVRPIPPGYLKKFSSLFFSEALT